MLMYDLSCDCIVLVSSEKKDALLPAHELKQLLERPPTSLVLIRLPVQAERTQIQHLGPWFVSWLRRLWRRQDGISQVQDVPDVEAIPL